MRHRAKFREDWSNRSGDMAYFRFLMAAVRHLEFAKVGVFNCPYTSGGQNASLCQISPRSVESFRRYGRFWIFKMAAVRHLGFLTVRTFNCPYPFEGQNASSCQILRRSVQPFRRYGRFFLPPARGG